MSMHRVIAFVVSMIAVLGCSSHPQSRTPKAAPVLRHSPLVVTPTPENSPRARQANAKSVSLGPTAMSLSPAATSLSPAAVTTSQPAQQVCQRMHDTQPHGLYREDRPTPGRVVLTFDDGPYADHTPFVLDSLEAHGFHATFFVLGRHITAKTYHVIQRMEADGHTIASHSYDHDIRMAQNHGGVAYIRAQHEVTRILVELALLASSQADFEAMFASVFSQSSARRLPPSLLHGDLATTRARHQTVLAKRGHPRGRYAVLDSRPPGGGPFLGTHAALRSRYEAALTELGMRNVMWHAQSGDVDATRARETDFLVRNITSGARRGGVLLLHDFIQPRALTRALDKLAADETTTIIPLAEALHDKYGCVAPAGSHASTMPAPVTDHRARSASLR